MILAMISLTQENNIMINYSKQSWHYRLNEMIAFKSTVPNNFASTEYIPGYTCKGKWIESRYELKENFCDYWRALFLYFTLQVPGMFIFGSVISLILIFLPLFTIFCFIIEPMAFLLYIANYTATDFYIGISLIIIYLSIGISALINYRINKIDNSVFPQLYDAWKLKYCPSVKFVDEPTTDKKL